MRAGRLRDPGHRWQNRPVATTSPRARNHRVAAAAWPVLVPGTTEPAAVLRLRWQLGELARVVDDLYLPADLEPWPLARCAALREVLRPGWAVGLSASVWARGGPGRAPHPAAHDAHDVDVLAPPATALRVADGVRVRLVRVPASGVERVHGVEVTTLVRTAADLALWGTGRDDDALAWVWDRGTDPADVVDDLVARGPVPGLARAARVLRAVRCGTTRPLARSAADGR